MPPILYIKSVMRLSEDGLGDGTAYATGTSATVSQPNKTISLVGKVLIADLGADADDKFNGHLLYFTTTGNTYHIVDWVSATSTATVWETPSTLDTGACEVRRALVDNKALASNPALRLVDGLRGQVWKPSGTTDIEIHLQNHLLNGGFESPSISPWTKTVAGGTTDASGRNTTTPLLGNADYKMNLGDRTSITLVQNFVTLKKNTTYSLSFKAKHTGTFVPSSFRFIASGFTGAELIFSNPSSGTISNTSFFPTLTLTSEWHSVDIATPKDYDIVPGNIQILLISASFDVFIDEIYLFEKINVSALCVFDHLGFFNIDKIVGRKVTKDRSGQTAGTDNVDLIGTQFRLLGGNAVVKEFSGGVYPVYTLELSSVAQASEMLLGEKWALPFTEEMPARPQLVKRKQNSFETRSGVRFKTTLYRKKMRNGTFKALSAADAAIYNEDWVPSHFERDQPFVALWETGDSVLLMINDSDESGLNYNSVLPDWAFKFVEVL